MRADGRFTAAPGRSGESPPGTPQPADTRTAAPGHTERTGPGTRAPTPTGGPCPAAPGPAPRLHARPVAARPPTSGRIGRASSWVGGAARGRLLQGPRTRIQDSYPRRVLRPPGGRAGAAAVTKCRRFERAFVPLRAGSRARPPRCSRQQLRCGAFKRLFLAGTRSPVLGANEEAGPTGTGTAVSSQQVSEPGRQRLLRKDRWPALSPVPRLWSDRGWGPRAGLTGRTTGRLRFCDETGLLTTMGRPAHPPDGGALMSRVNADHRTQARPHVRPGERGQSLPHPVRWQGSRVCSGDTEQVRLGSGLQAGVWPRGRR